jgi:hypothetical protein
LLFVIDPGAELFEPLVRRVHRRLPALTGAPIHIQLDAGLQDRHGPVHAGAFLRERRIAFDCTRAEFPRIFVHELFHFVWLRLGNARRRDFENLLRAELDRHIRGELGWAAEWRKRALSSGDISRRSRRWREYCCEAFCDTAARFYSGVGTHREFTLANAARLRRRQWFEIALSARQIPV